MRNPRIVISIATCLLLTATLSASAGGDKNTYNNPNGSPEDSEFSAPYMNIGTGRVLVYCEEGETLTIVPIGSDAAEAVCVSTSE